MPELKVPISENGDIAIVVTAYHFKPAVLPVLTGHPDRYSPGEPAEFCAYAWHLEVAGEIGITEAVKYFTPEFTKLAEEEYENT